MSSDKSMNKPTPESAEKFARKAFLNDKTPEDRDWHLFHSKAVGDCAIILAGKEKVDKKLIKIAGWLHDIGQIVSMEDHASRSLKMAEKEFEINDKLKDCIINHGNHGEPVCEEARLINISDKVSMLNPEFIKLFMKDSANKPSDKKVKDIDFVKSMLSNAGNLLENI